MGTLWRSEPMQLVQLFVQIEAARDTVDELGKLGKIQFKDLNPEVSAFQRNFVNDVKNCDEMERKVRFFEDQIMKEKREIELSNHKGREEMALLKLDLSVVKQESLETKKKIHEYRAEFDELERELIQMNSNQEALTKEYNIAVEMKHVLQKDSSFFIGVPDASPIQESTSLLAETIQPSIKSLGFVTGVILRSKFPNFERILWRVLRGNLFMKHAEIEDKIKDPINGELVDKNVFIIFYQGERSQLKIKKVCDSYGADLYPCPDTSQGRKNLLEEVNSRLQQLESVLVNTKKHRRQQLLEIGVNCAFWKEMVIKEKSIYHTMNMFNYDVGRKCLIAEGWCPKNATEKIVNAMRRATESSGALVPSILSVIQSNEEPPTYFQTNKFTRSFQAIVDAYGIAHYQEVNPAPFTIITFPFLFAVMFGDFGHGLLFTIFALYLVLNEKKLGEQKLNELVKTCYDGRYMLLLMGLFSMYTGLLYNECFSVPLDIFGTNWRYVGNSTEAERIDPDRVYPFGVDPAWKGVPNSLSYYNSLKMKMSVLLGVTHMVLGIILSLLNALHFKKPLNIIGEFIPQMIFMLGLFGYMCFLIVVKWCKTWEKEQPPLLLNVMISMFLSPTSVGEDDQVFPGQLGVQLTILFLCFISVPWMLLLKPLMLRMKHNSKAKRINKATSLVESDTEEEEEDDHFDFGEIFIKQIIHTIEFVLGAVSNTASYLRLWALSLAHAELSEVFWDRVFIQCYEFGGFYFAFVGFAIWAGATIGVLMIMESLSAFLHALRLHWVEFQNKFYLGDGRAFQPFSYERILKAEED